MPFDPDVFKKALVVVFGQANLRTRKAEAARKAMEPFEEAGGFESGVFYMMD